jgi:hypothetical protein
MQPPLNSPKNGVNQLMRITAETMLVVELAQIFVPFRLVKPFLHDSNQISWIPDAELKPARLEIPRCQ